MTLKRNIRTLFAMATLVVGSTFAFAHNGIEHVMGPVTGLTSSSPWKR